MALIFKGLLLLLRINHTWRKQYFGQHVGNVTVETNRGLNIKKIFFPFPLIESCLFALLINVLLSVAIKRLKGEE